MNFIGLGVAGNFHKHLEQVGEARNFSRISVEDPLTPKGLFPWYVPNGSNVMGTNPLSRDALYIPIGIDIHPEPELAIYCDISYESNGRIRSLQPKEFTAFNDASMRNITKGIPQKKNWGQNTKGIASVCVAIDHFDQMGNVSSYSIVSWLKRKNQWYQFSDICRVDEYMLFYEPLLAWLIHQCNYQKDDSPLEHLGKYFRQARLPSTAIIGCGATRYTKFGEGNYLRAGDVYCVAVYNHSKIEVNILNERIKTDLVSSDNDCILLRQSVVSV